MFLSRSERRLLTTLLFAVLLVRLLSLGAYPFFEDTETRYAEIARLMVTGGDWIVLHITPTFPFWAKPPMSTWVTAASMSVLGFNEFAARLPEFLLGLASTGLVAYAAWRRGGRDLALLASLALSSMILFFVAAGAVMTDMSLLFCLTLGMVAFWRVSEDGSKLWGYLFFVGMGLGLLAKGPLALVLTGFSGLIWAVWKKRMADIMRLPWMWGGALMLLIGTPWYLAVEQRTPGFLHYFIIGEHIMRFLVKNYHGDLYGHEHSAPRGTIWLFFLLGGFPWTLGTLKTLGGRVVGRLRGVRAGSEGIDDWTAYFLAWVLATPIFFTLAGNIIWTYVLPCLPAYALLLAEQWRKGAEAGKASVRWGARAAALVAPVLMIVAIGLVHSRVHIPFKTAKWAQAAYEADRPSPQSRLFYLGDNDYSTRFYSDGLARHVDSPVMAQVMMRQGDVLAIPTKGQHPLPASLTQHLRLLARVPNYVLFVRKD